MPLVAEKEVSDRAQAELEQRITALQKSPRRCKQAVALIGPGDGDAVLCDAAYQIARRLARCGLAIVCGGRGGVMEAASRGAFEAGGTVIGLLPENDDQAANAYLTVAIPTGMGEMRNALIARSSLCLVAIGGGMGTLSEMAFGLKLGKPVFCLYPEFDLPDATRVANVDEAVARVLGWINHTA
jgi:uncharacterized protein (TIGR00725 family)